MIRDPVGDDSKLIEGCIKGDMTAWASFIKKYSNLITISIENRLKKYSVALSRQDIEDVRQNILTSLWLDRKIDAIKDHRSIPYWLAIVSGNAAMEYARKKRLFDPPKPISLFETMGDKEFIDFIPDGALNPRDEISRNELSQKLEAAVESLPSTEKLIIKLNLLYDKKYEEIADILDMPRGTIASHIRRVKERLKKALKYFR